MSAACVPRDISHTNVSNRGIIFSKNSSRHTIKLGREKRRIPISTYPPFAHQNRISDIEKLPIVKITVPNETRIGSRANCVRRYRLIEASHSRIPYSDAQASIEHLTAYVVNPRLIRGSNPEILMKPFYAATSRDRFQKSAVNRLNATTILSELSAEFSIQRYI